MSKKKSSTMTLRDFHGGSIPSELPLPSAPGMVVERKNDRPGSGGWHRGYGEKHSFSRQASGNFTRSLDDRISYLPNPANIGRNYDEDERKPVDGHIRRLQGIDSYEGQIFERQLSFERLPDRFTLENRSGFVSSRYVEPRVDRYEQEELNVASSKSQFEDIQRRYQSASPSAFNTHDYNQSNSGLPQAQQYQESIAWRQNTVQQPVGMVMSSGTGVQNVWTRSDVEPNRFIPIDQQESVADGKVQMTGVRISQASALEKVASGRWNSQPFSPLNESSVMTDYSQSHSGQSEGVTILNAIRNSTGYDNAAYIENARNEFSQSAYAESRGGIDTAPSRDSRMNTDKGGYSDSQYVDSRVVRFPDSARYVDDRCTFDEASWKGNAAQKESSRFLGSEVMDYLQQGYTRGHARVIDNESGPYAELRNVPQVISVKSRPESSLRREFEDGKIVDSNRSVASEYEKRNLSNRDTCLDQTYQYNKEEIGQEPIVVVSGKENFSHQINRTNDRSRASVVSDHDQIQIGSLRSPGERTTVVQIVSGTSSIPLETESRDIEERPKLKLLPRSKPLETDPTEHFQQEKSCEDSVTSQSVGLFLQDTTSGSSRSEESSQLVERPKLSLKPRSQAVYGTPENGSVKERMSVFGGARPRELVLKERGVDESLIVGVDPIPSPGLPVSSQRTPSEGNRVGRMEFAAQLDARSDQPDAGNARQSGKNDSSRLERNESHGKRETMDVDRRENRRGMDLRKEPERPDVDKQESWRRSNDINSAPVLPRSSLVAGEVSAVGSATTGGPSRIGIPSAADLAQVFSRSVSFSGSGTTGLANQRPSMPRTPGPTVGLESPSNYKDLSRSIPFSRLTESPGTRDISTQGGYRRTSAF